MSILEWERPIALVDIVIFTILNGKLGFLSKKRNIEPSIGIPALFGGGIRPNIDENAEESAKRVLEDKFGRSDFFFEQLKTFTGRTRDARGWSISISYIAIIPENMFKIEDDIIFTPLDEKIELAFDHNEIVETAIERIRGKGGYSTIPARFLPKEFTLPELERVYEIVTNRAMDTSSFRRKIMDLDIIEKIEGKTTNSESSRRPSQVYKLKKKTLTFDKKL